MAAYQAKKRRRVRRLRILWFVACFVLVGDAVALFVELGPPRTLDFLAGYLSWPDSLADVLQIALAVLGFAALVWRTGKAVARWDFEHFGDWFNGEVFEPVRAPTAAPGLQVSEPLPWIAPSDRSRATRIAHWNDLQAWVRKGADLSQPDAVRFAWALLVGRPGAGKSRTADELARSLARREVLGEHAAKSASEGGLKSRIRASFARRRLLIGAAWRRGWRRSAAHDPWDAGRPAHRRHAGNATLLQQSSDFMELLQNWRPRAPTLIVFEDPRVDEAQTLVRTLARMAVAEAAESMQPVYEFPVRLLIVNQTLPADLQLSPDASAEPTRAWGSALGHLTRDPWVFDESSYLSWPEFNELLRARFKPEDARGWLKQEDFEHVTHRGNPLLIEALLDWLACCSPGSKPPLHELTATKLLQTRAERLLTALTTADVARHSQWQLLAAATVSDGADRGKLAQIDTGAAARDDIDGSRLQRIFPNENVQQRIPPIRPDLIGYAYMDAVIESTHEGGVLGRASDLQQEANANAIAKLAWGCDAYCVLKTLDKLTDIRSRAPTEQTPARERLIRALEQSLETRDAVESLARSGVDLFILTREFTRYHLERGDSLNQVETLLSALPAARALTILEQDLYAAAQRPTTSGREVLAILSLLLTRAIEDLEFAAPRVLDLAAAMVRLLDMLDRRGTFPVNISHQTRSGFVLLGHLLGLRAQHDPGAAAADGTLALVLRCEAALWNCRPAIHLAIESFCSGFTYASADAPALQSILLLFEANIAALSNDRKRLASTLRALRARGRRCRQREEAELLVRSWARTAFAYGEHKEGAKAHRCAVEARRIVERFASLPLPERRELGDWHALAWARAAHAYSLSGDAANAERCGHTLSCNVAAFDDLPATERLKQAKRHAGAWAWVAIARNEAKDPDGALRCAQIVASIAARLEGLELRQLTEVAEWHALALAHASEAYGRQKDLEGAMRCTDAIATIRAPFDALPLAERRILASTHVRSWAHVSAVEGSDDTEDVASNAASKAAQIIAPFAALPPTERCVLSEWQTFIWTRVAQAKAKRSDTAGVARCTDVLAEIVAPFAALPIGERKTLAYHHTSAWVQASYAHTLNKDAPGTRRCTDMAARIVAPFRELPPAQWLDLAERLVAAWRLAAQAASTALDLAEATRCADSIGAIAAQFASLSPMERRGLGDGHTVAWMSIINIHGERDDAASAERCAETIAEIISPFAELPLADRCGLTQWHAAAWALVANIHSFQKDAANARRCAEKVGQIAAPFEALPLATRTALAQWHAGAWASLGYALHDVEEAKRCAEIVGEIVAPFEALPPEQRVELAVRHVYAWAPVIHHCVRNGNPVEATRYAELIDELIAPFATLPSAQRRELDRRRALAWARVSEAYVQDDRASSGD